MGPLCLRSCQRLKAIKLKETQITLAVVYQMLIRLKLARSKTKMEASTTLNTLIIVDHWLPHALWPMGQVSKAFPGKRQLTTQ